MQTIYILDYDADIAFALCKWFNAHGFEAKSFCTLEQLLKQLAAQQPDCIILDCLYGRVSLTSNVCRTFRQVYYYYGNIVLTSTTNLSIKDLQACSAAHFIAKPFELLEVLNVVNNLFKNALAISVA